MGLDLTGQTVSSTYKFLVQTVDGSFYDGLGNPISVGTPNGATIDYVDGSLAMKANNASLNSYVQKTGDTMSGTLIVPDISSLNTISFNQTVFANNVGNLAYDLTEETLSFGLADGGSLQMGKEVFDYYTNISGTTLVDGDIVSVTGVVGNRQAVELTNAKDSSSSFSCIGMVTSGPASPNQQVRITKIGDVHQLDTNSFIEGSPIFVDPENPGKLTQILPNKAFYIISIGSVLVSHSVNGIISIHLKMLSKLKDLGDVDGTTLTTTGQIPVYHSDVSIFDFDYNINNYATNVSVGLAIHDISLGGLSDIALTAPSVDQHLAYNGTNWVNANLSQVAAGQGTAFYLDDASSNLSQYTSSLLTIPSTTTEVTNAVTISNTFALLDSYVSASTGLGGTSIEGGQWEFDTYCHIDNNGGVSKILISIYKYNASTNTETFLFEASTADIQNVTVALDTTLTVQPSFTCDPSDRLVAKYYGYTNSGPARTITLYHNGNTNYSHFHTPLATRHNDLVGLQGGTANERYHLTLSELTQAQGMKAYVDASLLLRDASTSYLRGYIDSSLLARDNSINTLNNKNTIQDASIVRLDTSLNDVIIIDDYFYTKTIIDASFSLIPSLQLNASSGMAGTVGNIVYDASYLYVCTSTNTWGRLLFDYSF